MCSSPPVILSNTPNISIAASCVRGVLCPVANDMAASRPPHRANIVGNLSCNRTKHNKKILRFSADGGWVTRLHAVHTFCNEAGTILFCSVMNGPIRRSADALLC